MSPDLFWLAVGLAATPLWLGWSLLAAGLIGLGALWRWT